MVSLSLTSHLGRPSHRGGAEGDMERLHGMGWGWGPLTPDPIPVNPRPPAASACAR